MSLRVCILGSGSSGNCIYVGSDATHILIDAGLSGQETVRRLEAVGVDIDRICGICLTHEHDDHKAALGVLQRRLGVPLYANRGTIEALERDAKLRQVQWTMFTNGSPFEVGDLTVEPFSVPHDSYDPVGFVVSHAGARVGIVTDMGMATELIRARLRGCQVVVVESNHDEQMLKDADRPWSLKQRIAGRQGHLSNAQAGALLAEIAGEMLKVAFLAHLSADCNRPALALKTVTKALAEAGHGHVAVKLTMAEGVSEVVVCG